MITHQLPFSDTHRVDGNSSRREVADPKAADIVRGLWTCCKQIDPQHPGCVVASHSRDEARCIRCASWGPIAKIAAEPCIAHAGACEWFRYHGCGWPCCGATSVQHTVWATRAPLVWEARRAAQLTTYEWEVREAANKTPFGVQREPPNFGCKRRPAHELPPPPMNCACGAPYDPGAGGA